MVDVTLLGTLFKAVDWHSVRRLIFVGDHYQLPRLVRGRPFFDLIVISRRRTMGGTRVSPTEGIERVYSQLSSR